MNVVPRVTRPRVAGKNQAGKTFFNRDRVTDFELRFVPAACDSLMWCLRHLSHCDAPRAARTRSVETQVSSSLQERALGAMPTECELDLELARTAIGRIADV